MISDLRRPGGFLGAEHKPCFAGAAPAVVFDVVPPGAELSVRLAKDLRDVAVDKVHGHSSRGTLTVSLRAWYMAARVAASARVSPGLRSSG